MADAPVAAVAEAAPAMYIPILRLIIVTKHSRFCHSFVVKYDRILFLNQYILALILASLLHCDVCLFRHVNYAVQESGYIGKDVPKHKKRNKHTR